MSDVSVALNTHSIFAGKYLAFFIGDSVYGLPLTHVIEIIGNLRATRVPGIPHYIKGIINLRGKIVPVIDARLKMDIEEIEYDDRTCIIIVNWNESLIGLIVDSVDEVLNFSDEQLSELPDSSSVNGNKYISSVGKIGEKLTLILDCDRFLGDGVDLSSSLSIV